MITCDGGDDDQEGRSPMSSLVVIGRLGSHSREGASFYDPVYGRIDDLGFCSGADQTLSHHPPRPANVPYDLWCNDRFLSFQPDDGSSAIGRVDVGEALVYDNRMRSEIDFTGFKVIVSLQSAAYQAYLDYIGEVRWPATLSDQIAWDGRILFRIPSPPFRFPMPYGNSDPWETRKKVVRRLEVIKQFAFDAIEIQALRDAQGRRVKFEDAARDERSGWQPALSLHA
jgi:hypothetical protein